MALHFTGHALGSLKSRGIPRAAVRAAIKHAGFRRDTDRRKVYEVTAEQAAAFHRLEGWAGLRVVVSPGGDWVVSAYRMTPDQMEVA